MVDPQHAHPASKELRASSLTGIVLRFPLVFGDAIIVSLIGLASQTAYPPVYVLARKRGTAVLRPVSSEYSDDETFPGLLILRPEGRLFFLNAQNVADQITSLAAQHRPRVLVLDLSRVPDVEYSALEMLVEGERWTREQNAKVWLAGLNPSVLDVVRRAELDARLGKDRMLLNAETAVERFLQLFAADAAVRPSAQSDIDSTQTK